MSGTATLNVRMDAQTKEDFTAFCDEVGMSASSLMNVFAKTVVRNRRVPFDISSDPIDAAGTVAPAASRSRTDTSRLFPRDEAELEAMVDAAAAVPLSECIPADEFFVEFDRRMGW